MSVSLRLSKSKVNSISLEKFLKSQKNLSKLPPKLWPDDPESEPPQLDHQGLPVLNLSHPVLKKLESCKTFRDFRQIHSQLIIGGLTPDSLAASRVIKKLCTSLGLVSHAVSVFDSIHEPDAFLCNTILRGFVNWNNPSGALRFYYEKMVAKCVVQNHYTLPLLGKVCAEIGSAIEGEKMHTVVLKRGFESDLFVTNSLIHMYSSCGRICDARGVFDDGPTLDLVSWNSMIDGYIKNKEVLFARELFDKMPERDIFSWNSMLKGYVEAGDAEAAFGLFENMPVKDIVSWNCMLDGFASRGNALVAGELFDVMPFRNVVSWNIMLALCVRSKHYSDCLRLFDRMMEGGDIKPNEATLMSVLTACTNLRRLDTGKWVHNYVREHGIRSDILLSTALLTMYSKCGDMDSARDVFDSMPEKSVVSWNSMIIGYGVCGHGEKAMGTFIEMEKTRLVPNDATFVCVLSACAHSGKVLEGFWLFQRMCAVHKIKPQAEHYGCMVDLLGRAGLAKDSKELLKTTPSDAIQASLGALPAACWTHTNLELGKIVATRLIESQPDDIGPYLLLSNIYAVEGRWDDVENVRKMMEERRSHNEADKSELASSLANVSFHRRKIVFSMLREIATLLKLSRGDSSPAPEQKEHKSIKSFV